MITIHDAFNNDLFIYDAIYRSTHGTFIFYIRLNGNQNKLEFELSVLEKHVVYSEDQLCELWDLCAAEDLIGLSAWQLAYGNTINA